MNSKGGQSLHEAVAEKIIKKLEQGTAPWQKPWGSGDTGFRLPFNPITGNRYKGINSLSLLTADREDPRWMTFKQASGMRWNVRKGEKASLIQIVKTDRLVPQKDGQGKPVLDNAGRPVKMRVALDRAVIASAWVFNAEQIEGIPPYIEPATAASRWNLHERAENLIQSSRATVLHEAGDEAYYSLALDRISIPLREQFASPEKYYATLLHELGHWTGHPDRLDRGLMHSFATEDYAREELRAEIASLLIGQELGIGHDPAQHIAYVDSWIKILRDTPFEIHAAAADAEKILAYLLAFERKQERKNEQTADKTSGNSLSKSRESALVPGETIAYNGAEYKVQGTMQGGRLRMEDLSSGRMFALAKSDRLYLSLLDARNVTRNNLAVTSDIVPERSRGVRR